MFFRSEYDENDHHAFFAVYFGQHFGDLAFSEQNMHSIVAEKSGQIEHEHGAEKCPEDG